MIGAICYFVTITLFIVGRFPEAQLSSLIPRPRPAFRHFQYVLQVTESWEGPGNEATTEHMFTYTVLYGKMKTTTARSG